MSYLIDQRRLFFWQKMTISDNAVLFTLSRLISNQFMAVGSRYGITSSYRILFAWKFGIHLIWYLFICSWHNTFN